MSIIRCKLLKSLNLFINQVGWNPAGLCKKYFFMPKNDLFFRIFFNLGIRIF